MPLGDIASTIAKENALDDGDQAFWNDAHKEDPNQVEVADLILGEELEGLPVVG